MNHHHDHHHDHSHDDSSEMSMEEKLAKLLTHWIQHNEEHAKSYELWADRATSNGLPRVGTLLQTAAEKTRAANEDFKTALKSLLEL